MDQQSLKVIIKFLGSIGITLSLFFIIPIITGLLYHEEISRFILFDLFFFALNLLFYLPFKNEPLELGIKTSILIVNLIWILIGVAGGVALYLTSSITPSDAFFEAISGFTTTGATIYTDIESLSHTTLMLRSLMHWLGGMGVIVLGVGLLSLINPTGSLTLFKSEATGITIEKLTPKIKDTALQLWKIYLLLTLADTILLFIGGMSIFDAINHAFSTISTGGFSTKNSSLGFWNENPYILWVTTFFMFVSGVNFIAHLKALRGEFQGYLSEEIRWYFIIFVTLSIALTLIHYTHSNDTLFTSSTHAFFTISSILTTTGFASVDYSLWGHLAIVVIFVAMFIGGNAGSTAGGMKVIRYVVLFKNLLVQIKQFLHPNALVGLYIDGNRIGSKIVGSVTGFFFLFALSNLFLTLFLYAKGYDFLTAFSAAIACIGNIGPGFGHVGPADNFAFFSGFEKVVLALFMIVGRLEFYTFVILLSRDFWKKY